MESSSMSSRRARCLFEESEKHRLLECDAHCPRAEQNFEKDTQVVDDRDTCISITASLSICMYEYAIVCICTDKYPHFADQSLSIRQSFDRCYIISLYLCVRSKTAPILLSPLVISVSNNVVCVLTVLLSEK